MSANSTSFTVEKVNLVAIIFLQGDGSIRAIKPAQATFIALFFIQDRFPGSPIAGAILRGAARLG
jgi:hypothetical protein